MSRAQEPDQQGFVGLDRPPTRRPSHATMAWMKARGMAVAMVETGGEPGHAAARRTYEKLGFGLFPIARYFRKL